ncbi:hypothetical protein BGZ76_003199 [Entomortierella beljakovae]|nr:hypothetical protein BGZ76_003199 [Entomortierella beljakovae]
MDYENGSIASDFSPALTSSTYTCPSPVSPPTDIYAELGEQTYAADYQQPPMYSPSCSPADISHSFHSFHETVEEKHTSILARHPASTLKNATRPHPCDKCNKTFSRRYNLQQHEKTHEQSVRPYICPDKSCGKSFIRSADLERHKRIHSGEKPFTCRYGNCGEIFARTEARLRHEKKVHGLNGHNQTHKHSLMSSSYSFSTPSYLTFLPSLSSWSRWAYPPILDPTPVPTGRISILI